MKPIALPILEFILGSYHHFNAAALKNALRNYHAHLQQGGKMFWSLAGAMSSAPRHPSRTRDP